MNGLRLHTDTDSQRCSHTAAPSSLVTHNSCTHCGALLNGLWLVESRDTYMGDTSMVPAT